MKKILFLLIALLSLSKGYAQGPTTEAHSVGTWQLNLYSLAVTLLPPDTSALLTVSTPQATLWHLWLNRNNIGNYSPWDTITGVIKEKDSTKFVGIGTSQPHARLDVNGFGPAINAGNSNAYGSPSDFSTIIGFHDTCLGGSSLIVGSDIKSTADFVYAFGKHDTIDVANCFAVGDNMHVTANPGIAFAVFGGIVGIGTTNPTAQLEVHNSLKYVNGKQGLNKVAVSDAAGGVDWQAPAMFTGVQYETPTTGSTVTSDGSPQLVLDPAGALLTLTVVFPSTPGNGQLFTISSTQAITTLTLSGGTILGGITTITTNGHNSWVFSTAANEWVVR